RPTALPTPRPAGASADRGRTAASAATRPRGAARRAARSPRVRPLLGRHLADLRQALHDLIGTVPLRVVGALHPRAELGRAPEVVPRLEGGELDRLVERRRRQETVGLEARHDALALGDEAVDGVGRGVGVLVEVLDEPLAVAGAADALHARPVVLPRRPALADRGEEVPGEPVA